VVPSSYRERNIPQKSRTLETRNKVSLALVCDVFQNDRKLIVLWFRRQILITSQTRLFQPKISDLGVPQFSSFTIADREEKEKCFWLP
jgi:hypothetical protein